MRHMKSHPLKAERKRRGWSQAKVAEALSVSTKTIIRWEQGQVMPQQYYREQLSMLYGKTAQDLGLLPDIDENDAEEQVLPATSQPTVPDIPERTLFLADPTIPEALEGGAH